MVSTIKAASSTVVHPKCGKEIARIVDGVLYVKCFRKGCGEWHPFTDWVEKDSLDVYRRIQGLIVIGPQEIERAFLTSDGENPLGLEPGWCPRIPVPYPVEQIEAIAKLCQTREWNTTPILWLALPKIGGTPTSLADQYNWWGVAHDSKGPGKVRENVFWSNWFRESGPEYNFAKEAAVAQPEWNISYEFAGWGTNLNWERQQKAVRERGLTIPTAARDALMLNLVLATTGRRLRSTTWARTSTRYDGRLLDLHSDAYGVDVSHFWHPGNAGVIVGVAVEGVPLELGG